MQEISKELKQFKSECAPDLEYNDPNLFLLLLEKLDKNTETGG